MYQHLEDQLSKADDILALTTTREGATNLRNYFTIADKRLMQKLQSKLQVPRPNTALLFTGCQPSSVEKGTTWIMTAHTSKCGIQPSHRPHHPSLSAEHARDAWGPAGSGSSFHGVQTIYTCDNKEPTVRGSLDLTATQVAQATIVFQQALLLHPMWLGPLPVCLAEYHLLGFFLAFTLGEAWHQWTNLGAEAIR